MYLKMVYCELDVVMKTVSCIVMTIAKYKLISHVCVHFIWQGGVYLNMNTLSEHTNCYLMSLWTSLHWMEGISESVLFIHMWYPCPFHLFDFIWGVYLISEFTSSEKVYCHYLHYELLNTEQCRLLYVVVIVVTIAYSYCYFVFFYV